MEIQDIRCRKRPKKQPVRPVEPTVIVNRKTKALAKEMGEPICFVYVFSVDDQWICKVGYSGAPKARLTNINTASFIEISTYIALGLESRNRAIEVESAVHDLLKAHRVKGEWFRCQASDCALLVQLVAQDRSEDAFIVLQKISLLNDIYDAIAAKDCSLEDRLWEKHRYWSEEARRHGLAAGVYDAWRIAQDDS